MAGPGSLFETYNPEGAMGGLFAPAHIPGFAPSEDALRAYYAQRINMGDVDSLRMPNEEPEGPPAGRTSDGRYGSTANRQIYRDPRGTVSQDVLRAAAQGSPFNPEARRAAIAERVARNERIRAQRAAQEREMMMAAFGNPYMAGMQFGQGMGAQLQDLGMPLPPQRGY